METKLDALKTYSKKDAMRDVNKFSSLTREELETRILQLEAHNIQLKNILARSNQGGDDPNLSSKSKGNRPFDFSKHQKRHILLKFAYLGWDRQGFTVQEDTPNTVEAALFDALLKTKLVESRQTSNYHRCGRTDKGVSAFSQVISITVRSCLERPLNQEVSQNGDSEFDATKVLPQNGGEESKEDLENELNYPQILNRVLPLDVRVLSWSPIQQEFSARFDCLRRTYKYFFPLANLDLEAMRSAAQYLVGQHDFRNFCKMDVGNGVVKFIRNIISISISEVDSENLISSNDLQSGTEYKNSFEKGEREICETEDNDGLSWKKGYKMCMATIEGNAFLWHQIRAMMSILILVGEGKEDPQVAKKLLDIDVVTRKPQYGLAREDGLNLYETNYKDINWQYDYQNISQVLCQLKNIWTGHSIKSSMLQSMMSDLSNKLTEINGQKNHNIPWTLESYITEPKSKVYIPLLKRKTCKSLEECVQTHVKRGRLDPSIMDGISIQDKEAKT